MRPHPRGRVLGLLAGVMLVGAGAGLRAGEPPSEKMLAKRGLKRAGPYFVLTGETDVHAKADELRQLSRELSHATAVQRSTASEKDYQDTVKELTAELNQFRAQSNAVTQNINRMPRRRGYPVYWEQYQELTFYKNQLQMEIQQRQNVLTQLKSKPFDPRDRINADNEVHNKQNAVQEAAQELRKLIDEVHAKYPEVEKDPDVKKWLDTPEGRAAIKPKLGPSRTFLADQKMLERVERQSSSAGGDDPFAPASKSSKKGRRTTKGKKPTAPTDSASTF